MHIVRIAEQFPPARGGLAPGMLALSLEQHRSGHRVTVITRDAPGSGDIDRKLPFQITRIPASTLMHFGWQAFTSLRALHERPDVVHCHGPAAAPILFRTRKLDPPVVVTLHAIRKYQYGLFINLDKLVREFESSTGLPVQNSPRLYRSWMPRFAWELMVERYICQKAGHLALVAEYFQRQVAEYYGVASRKCTVTYNGSDFHKPTSGGEKKARVSFGFDDRDKIILYVGRLDWVKRTHILVQAMPEVLRSEKRARLLLVGDGDQRSDLEILIVKMGLKDRVSVLGWLPHRDLQSIYGCANCLSLPSIWEGLSKVILEAMSMGIPVLASDIPANREVLQSGKAGILVDKPDPASWAKELCSVLNTPVESHSRAQMAEESVNQKYRWSHVAERLDKVYMKLT